MNHQTRSPFASRTPLVSICIPAYKAERHLEETLRSVAAQSVTDWELIVTEDGSADSTEEIVRRFGQTVPQDVRYTRHEKNRGLPSTRNTGIQAARGTWVAFLDSDDLWKPHHLEALVGATRATLVDLVFSGTEWFEDGSGKVVNRSVPSAADLGQLPVALFAGRLSILPSSVMIRRTCFDRFGPISTEYPHVNDTEYWLRVLKGGGRVAYSGQETCLYRKHTQSMSNRAAELLADSALLCEKYADWDAIPRELRKRRPADLYRWAGKTLFPDNKVEAAKLVRHALRLEPLNPKTLALALRHWRQMLAA